MSVGDDAIAEVKVKIGMRRGEEAAAVCVDLEMWQHATCAERSIPVGDFYPPWDSGYRGDLSHPYPTHVRDACRSCPIAVACRGYATAAGEPGYWGGTRASERAGTVNRLALLRESGLSSRP